MDTDSGVCECSVASPLAGMVADPAHDGGEGVFLYQFLPGLFPFASLCQCQPSLDVLACWAGFVAGWQHVEVKWALLAGGPRSLGVFAVVDRGGHFFLMCHIPWTVLASSWLAFFY